MSFKKIKKAIEQHHLKDVEKLVEATPEIVHIENSDGETPLFVAVREQRENIVKYLIDNEADINHKSTKDGWTVLHIACSLINVELVELLLDNEADIEATTSKGATPLYLVCEYGSYNEGSIEIINTLLDNSEQIDNEVEEKDKSINQKAEHGYFPLYIACKNGDNDIVELLLERGANVLEKNNVGITALMIAVQENKNGSHLELIKTLLEAGVDLLYTDNTGRTALFYAQESDDNDVLHLLMQYAPDSPTSSTTSSTPTSSTPTSSTPTSSAFTIDSFESTELDTVIVNKSQIPETAEDVINIEDVNIVDFLAESDQNRIIKVHNSFYAVNCEDVKTHYLTGNQKKHYIYYPCKRALPPPALGVSKNDVHMDKPLFSASYLVGVLSDFVLLNEVNAMFESENKYFEIIPSEFEDIPATATAQMFTANANAVSANHCQEGKEAKIIKLKMINIVDDLAKAEEEEAVAKGIKKRKTVSKNKKTAKKRTAKKRNTVSKKKTTKKRKQTVNKKNI